MCEVIHLNDGRTISTIGELVDHFGPITTDMNPNHLTFDDPEECLCAVNVAPLMREKGFRNEYGDWWEGGLV